MPSAMQSVQKLLDRQLSIRQLSYLAIMGTVLLVIPYLIVGMVWAGSHSEHLGELTGTDKVFSLLGEIVAWPVLLIANVQLV